MKILEQKPICKRYQQIITYFWFFVSFSGLLSILTIYYTIHSEILLKSIPVLPLQFHFMQYLEIGTSVSKFSLIFLT